LAPDWDHRRSFQQAESMSDGVLSAIGNTPAVRLAHLVDHGMAEIWVKLEAANPTGSYKDRMALAMIEAAERAGGLQSGQPVVEYTGGSTGSSLAFVCAVTGHPLHIVTSDAFALEKRRAIEAFGAEVEIVPSPDGITPELIPRMRARAAELAATLGAYQTDQFTNTDMVDGYRSLGEEIAAQVPGPIDALCLYVGTAGCFLGVSQALRRHYPELSRVAVEPAESAVLSGHPAGTHRIEGGGAGFRPDLLTLDDVDEVVAVPTATAFAMARDAARREGLFSGPSTGANLVAALDLAGRLGPGRRVVTIQVDSGLKYLTGHVYGKATTDRGVTSSTNAAPGL
jgi:cysteine synthase